MVHLSFHIRTIYSADLMTVFPFLRTRALIRAQQKVRQYNLNWRTVELFQQARNICCVLQYSGALYLHAAVAPAFGHPVDILLQPVHIGVLGYVGPCLLHRRPHVLHVLLQLVYQALQKIKIELQIEN